MTATTTLAERVERIFRERRFDDLAALYAPDVILDVHVPQWRFQLQGAGAAAGWYNEQVAEFPGCDIPWLRVTPMRDGVVVEWELRMGSGDGEVLCREVDIFRGDESGVTEHLLWCTGMWDAATIARQRSDAPMVRW